MPPANHRPARLAQLDVTIEESDRYVLVSQGSAPAAVWRRPYKAMAQGGFGAIYREECIGGQDTGQVRVVKVLEKPRMKQKKAEAKVDFSKELRAIAWFSAEKFSSYFVRSDGYYEDSTSIYITLDFYEHGDLQQHIEDGLPEGEAQLIMRQVLQGLAYMHEVNFAHRDLKPANLLVAKPAPNWHVKITDFGLSKQLQEGITSLRTVAGTRAFMAPEQQGLKFDESASRSYTLAVDIWAVGTIAYLILTGELPFPTMESLIAYVQAGSFPQELLDPKVSAKGRTMIQEMMSVNPSRRPSAKTGLEDQWIRSVNPEMSYTVSQGAPSDMYTTSWAPATESWSTLELAGLRPQPLQTASDRSDFLAHDNDGQLSCNLYSASSRSESHHSVTGRLCRDVSVPDIARGANVPNSAPPMGDTASDPNPGQATTDNLDPSPSPVLWKPHKNLYQAREVQREPTIPGRRAFVETDGRHADSMYSSASRSTPDKSTQPAETISSSANQVASPAILSPMPRIMSLLSRQSLPSVPSLDPIRARKGPIHARVDSFMHLRVIGDYREVFQHSVAFSPDGKYVAAMVSLEARYQYFPDDIMMVWETSTGDKVFRSEKPDHQFRYVHLKLLCFSPNARLLAWHGSDCQIFIAQTSKWSTKSFFMPGSDVTVHDMVFSPDSSILVVTLSHNRHSNTWPSHHQILRWHVKKWSKMRHRFPQDESLLDQSTLAFSPSSKQLIVATSGHRSVTVNLVGPIDSSRFKLKSHFDLDGVDGEAQWPLHISFGGRFVAVNLHFYGPGLKLWQKFIVYDIATGQRWKKLEQPEIARDRNLIAVGFTSDDRFLIVQQELDLKSFLWSLPDMKEVAMVLDLADQFRACSPSNNLIAVRHTDDHLRSHLKVTKMIITDS